MESHTHLTNEFDISPCPSSGQQPSITSTPFYISHQSLVNQAIIIQGPKICPNYLFAPNVLVKNILCLSIGPYMLEFKYLMSLDHFFSILHSLSKIGESSDHSSRPEILSKLIRTKPFGKDILCLSIGLDYVAYPCPRWWCSLRCSDGAHQCALFIHAMQGHLTILYY